MICISIKRKKFAGLSKALKQANELADIVEIWFDEVDLNNKQLNKIFDQAKRPILYKVTNSLNKKIAEKCKYIDLDITTPLSVIKNIPKNSTLILSYHNFDETPSDLKLKSISNKALKKGANIVKIATTTKTLGDSLRILTFLKNFTEKGNKAIFLGMGKKGVLTRLTGHLFGNYLMYFSLSQSDKTAPGQITAKEFKQITWHSK